MSEPRDPREAPAGGDTPAPADDPEKTPSARPHGVKIPETPPAGPEAASPSAAPRAGGPPAAAGAPSAAGASAPAAAASAAAAASPAPAASAPAGAAPAPAPRPAPKAPPTPPAPQIPKNPGGAARLAKAATIVAEAGEQEPLAVSNDLGWWVLNSVLMASLAALAAITIYSCTKAAIALFAIF